MGLAVIFLLMFLIIVMSTVMITVMTMSRTQNKGLKSAMKEMGIAFTPMTKETFWVTRAWYDTTFTSRVPSVSGNLEAFSGVPLEQRMNKELIRLQTGQKDLSRGNAVVNDIPWNYAISTNDNGSGTIIRTLIAVTGYDTKGLLFEVFLGKLGTIPSENIEEILSFITRGQ